MAKRDLPGWFSAEVDWLVNCSEGEMGLKAQPLEPGCGGPPDTLDDMHVDAASREKRARAALATLPDAWVRLLLVCHEHQSPRRCKEAHAAHQRLCERVADLMVASGAFKRAWLACGAHSGRKVAA